MTSIQSHQAQQQEFRTSPTQSTFDPSFNRQENLNHPSGNLDRSVGSRNESPPHEGPGTACYVRQPTRAQLKEASSTFGSAKRPFYYKDPEGIQFTDIDGNVGYGVRWIRVDLRDGESGSKGCCVM